MVTQLAFRDVKFTPINHNNQIWFTSKELAAALKYASTKAVTDIYNKNIDEFTDGMSQVVESTTSGNYRKKTRIFSLRGAHLIAMFARTPVAKEFRRWVLDILDREIQQSPITKQFTDNELCTLAWLWRAKKKNWIFSIEKFNNPQSQNNSLITNFAHLLGYGGQVTQC
ncbi:BRO family protein [Escherichia coli]|uniref:BRO family protein n=1 Tax=Escherichia coli TaxID=562 RepID=UPI00201AD29B|nr:BRO family protein [Escherichia coli]